MPLLRDTPPPAAILLAAGRGNRLMPLTQNQPKCLVEIGGAPILIHQLRALRAAGLTEFQIITGHGADRVREVVDQFGIKGITFANNPDYKTTSSLYSLGCTTLDPGSSGFVILNTDVLFHPDLAKRLLADPRSNVLLAEFGGLLGEEEMKITVDSDYRITGISKGLDPALAQAENLGVLKLGGIAADEVLRLARLKDISEKEGFAWLPDAIHALREDLDFFALPTGGALWTEIDYHHDLRRARNELWPKLSTAMASIAL